MTVRTRGSAVAELDHLIRCPQEIVGTAEWWASLEHHLGELGEELARSDVAGLAAQVTADAPHFAASAHRLPSLDVQTRRDLARLRREVADQYGAPTAIREVCSAVDGLLRRVRTLHRLSSDLMLDTYERDLGGD